MTASRSQSDSAPHDTANLSQPNATGHHTEPLLPDARDNGLGHTQLPADADTWPNNGRHNGTPKGSIEDHPEWSAYLASRHILEPAIAAESWVEREERTGQNVLVWRARRRDGNPGATRRRLLKKLTAKQAKLRWQFAGQKTDEPFYYVGTLEDLKREIARAGGKVYIVEGEFDVWSLHRLGIRNVIGLYGISNIPKDIGAILDEIGAIEFIYLADNDTAGEKGGSNLRTLLHESGWSGEGDYRRVVGPGIPDKGDANNLLCHHFPDMPEARAALEALPSFEPRLKRTPQRKPASDIDQDLSGWDAVKEDIRIALDIDLDDFNRKGFSKNFRCLNPHHEDKTPSAAWHKDGFYKCFGCGEELNAKEMAERLGIDWRPLIRPQPKLVSSRGIDLNAAPQIDSTEAPLSFDQAPDSWLRLLIKFCKPTEAVLFHYVPRALKANLLATNFTRGECMKALRKLGCHISDGAIYKVFQEVAKCDNQLLFVKVDPSEGSGSRNCKFQLHGLDDIRRRIAHVVRYRVYESTFHKHRDTLIDFKVFNQAKLGSEFTITLESALKPLYKEQKERFESLKHVCEQKIAAYQTDMDDLSATPLPDWTIDKPSELPALLARGIYGADPEDRSKREWAWLLGISESSVDATLKRASIERRAYTEREEVSSQREAKDRARELGAKIVGLEVDGSYLPYDAAMDIPQGSLAIFQPPAKHEIVSDEKQIVKAPPAKPSIPAPANTPSKRADNMRKPGNWHKPSWDPQFIYWELVKACCLLHGYEIIDDIGITDPQTGEVWTDPTLEDLVRLISGKPGVAEPDTD